MAACRSALLFGATASGQRAAAHLKNSLGPLGKSIGYTIGEEGFKWTGESDLTAADILEAEAGPEEASEREDAAAWLEGELFQGPQIAGELLQRGDKAGYSRRTLRRAFASLGGTRTRDGFGPGSRVVWSLPAIGDTPPAIGAKNSHLGPYDETSATRGFHGTETHIGAKSCVPGTYGKVPSIDCIGAKHAFVGPYGETTPLKGPPDKGSTIGANDEENGPYGKERGPYVEV
jgi:hypothetical protein